MVYYLLISDNNAKKQSNVNRGNNIRFHLANFERGRGAYPRVDLGF